MRFAVSLLSLRPGRIGGTETYLRELLREMPAEAGQDELVVVMDRDVARGLETPGFERVVVDQSAGRIVLDRVLEAYTVWRSRGLERAFERIGADALFFPQQSIFPKRVRGPVVLTVVDVGYLFYPESLNLFDRTFRPAVYPRSMERADRIVAISEFTKRTVVARCGVPPSKVVSIPLGFRRSDAQSVKPTELVRGPYVYYPAVTHPFKNHALLFRTYAALKKSGRLSEKLVLTGAKTPAWRDLERLARELGVGNDVVHLGYLPSSEVRRVYAGASAVLFPTRFEGFGLPVTEAVEFGKKVITSRLEIFDELGVPKRFQIDFGEPEELLRALRSEGTTVLEREPSSWREMAARTLKVLRQVGSGRSDSS